MIQRKGRPVLVGTTSIEKSEKLSNGLFDRRGIKHEVLNAKQHKREAEIVAQAGRTGAVTIATNMAGRGTDIILGGNPENDGVGDPTGQIRNSSGRATAKNGISWSKRSMIAKAWPLWASSSKISVACM